MRTVYFYYYLCLFKLNRPRWFHFWSQTLHFLRKFTLKVTKLSMVKRTECSWSRGTHLDFESLGRWFKPKAEQCNFTQKLYNNIKRPVITIWTISQLFSDQKEKVTPIITQCLAPINSTSKCWIDLLPSFVTILKI